jgi:hypothetical protein
MKFGEAWKLSGIPYKELVFRSYMQTRGGGGFLNALVLGDPTRQAQARERAIRQVLRASRWNKLAISLVVGVASGISFLQYALHPDPASLLGASSLSLLMLLGYSVLYEIQILPGLIGADSLEALRVLPISVTDLSKISIFAFVRTIDYIIVAGILVPSVLIALLTHSFIATLLQATASTVNMVFASALSLILARLFYKNLSKGGRSKTGTVLRLAFIMMWGLLVLSLGFFYNFLNYLSPVMAAALQSGNTFILALLAVLHPFSFSFAITASVFGGLPDFYMISLAASAAYIILAAASGRWALGTTANIAYGRFVSVSRDTVKDLELRIRPPLIAYALKDFRVASRNPNTAFLVAAPVLETVIIVLPLISANIVGTLPTMIGTFVGGMFASFTTLGLLNAEGTGFEYTKTLPVRVSTTIRAKAFTATLTYLPVPFVFFLLSFFKPLTHNLLYTLPMVGILAVSTASLAEVTIFLAASGSGRVVAFNASSGMLYFFLALAVAALLVGLPLAVFGILRITMGVIEVPILLSGVAVVAEFLLLMKITSRRG